MKVNDFHLIEEVLDVPAREILISLIRELAHAAVQQRFYHRTVDGLRMAIALEHMTEDLRKVCRKYGIMEEPCVQEQPEPDRSGSTL